MRRHFYAVNEDGTRKFCVQRLYHTIQIYEQDMLIQTNFTYDSTGNYTTEKSKKIKTKTKS